MPLEYIWTVSADGVPFRIPARPDPRCTSEAEWEEMRSSSDSPIRTVVSSSTAAFAIDRAGRVLVLVLPSHIAIRERVEIWANQVWIVQWMSPLFLDRPRFSDESGKVSKDPSLEDVEPGWSWEEPWATHLDPRKFDADGWQYAFSFLVSSWEKKCRRFHLVRRKMLKRNMRYTAHDQWVEVLDEESRMFTELAIGGSELMEESLLFALGTDGNVFRREGIQTNRPAGTGWEKLPKIRLKGSEVDDVTLIAVSPSMATLLCVTWDGKMYHRKGISRKMPSGVAWQQVATPRNKAVICAAIGTETIWCITSDGSVWFNRVEIDEKRKEHLMETITSEGYQLVTQGGVSRLSVTKNDQVFCVTTRDKIQCRTGISKDEPSGRRFETLVDRGEPKGQKWISLDVGAVSLREVPEYFLSSSCLQSKMEVMQFKKAEWRLKILERLQEASDRSWSAMKNVKGAELDVEKEGKETVRRIRCQRRIEKTSNVFKSVNVAVTPTHIEMSGDADFRKSIDISAVKSVLPTLQRLPQKYLLNVFITSESDSECFAFTDEKSRGSFQTILENMIREQICSSTRSSSGESMWSVSTEGVVRWHCLAEMSKESKYEKRVNPGDSRGLLVAGNFESIDCGAKRLVWAVNQSGALYSLSTQFDPLRPHEEHDYKMTDETTLRMFEYQKATLFRGYQSFENTQSGGISGWMCCGRPCPAFFSSLPSTDWSWCDANWKLDDEEAWKYSNELHGTYVSSEKEKGKVRRRVWTRRARFESKKSPWCHVEAPPVNCVRIAKRENENGDITVLILTKDGHILSRNGVNRQNFAGENWTQILTDFPLISIHIESQTQCLWAATADGSIISKTLKTGSASPWKHLEMDLSLIVRYMKSEKSFELTGYSRILYARLGSCLFRIDTENDTISDPYPMDNLQQAVVNAQGSICVRGTNITVIREWRVTPYIDRKATIIAMLRVERACDMGRAVQCVAFY